MFDVADEPQFYFKPCAGCFTFIRFYLRQVHCRNFIRIGDEAVMQSRKLNQMLKLGVV